MGRGQKDEKRKFIIKIATEIFAQKGYENTDIVDILKAAEISKSTFYYYFKSKRDLYESMLQEFFNEIMKIIWSTEYRTLKNRSEIEKYIEKLINTYADFAEKYAPMIKIILSEATIIDPSFGEVLDRNIEALLLTIVDFVTIYKEKDIIRKDLDPTLFSYLIAGFVKEVINHVVIKETFTIDRERVSRFIRIIFECIFEED